MDATLAARIEVAAHTIADLDRRLGQIDTAIEEAAKRGRTTTALAAIEKGSARPVRASWTSETMKPVLSWPPSRRNAPQ
jgi:phage terminase large subunit-like protein